MGRSTLLRSLRGLGRGGTWDETGETCPWKVYDECSELAGEFITLLGLEFSSRLLRTFGFRAVGGSGGFPLGWVDVNDGGSGNTLMMLSLLAGEDLPKAGAGS